MALLLTGAEAQAQVQKTSCFVSPEGSDSNDGSRGSPWKTLQHAADNAPIYSLIHIAQGPYKGFHISENGKASVGGVPHNVTDATLITLRNISRNEPVEAFNCTIYVAPQKLVNCDGSPVNTAPPVTPPVVEEPEEAEEPQPVPAVPSARKQCSALPTVVSSYERSNTPVYARDNHLNTRWSMNGKTPWIPFDLGAVQSLDQVGIAWHRGQIRKWRFAVDVSADGTTWKRAYEDSNSGTSNDIENYDFGAQQARYVRIVDHGNGEHDWTSITGVALDKGLPEEHGKTCKAVAAPGGFASASRPGTGKVYRVSKSGGGNLCSLSQVNALKLNAGDSVLFEGGTTWNGRLTLNVNGMEENPVYVGSYGSGAKPKIDGGNKYDGSGGIVINGKGVVIDGMEVTGFSKAVMPNSNASIITIQNMHLHHIGQECVALHDEINYFAVLNSEINHCGQKSNGEGIYIGTDPSKSSFPDATHNILVRGNYIHDMHDEAVEVKPSAYNVTIENNRVVNAHNSINGSIMSSMWRDAPKDFTGNVVIRNNTVSRAHVGIRMKTGGIVSGNTVTNTKTPIIIDGVYKGSIAVSGNTGSVKIQGVAKVVSSASYAGAALPHRPFPLKGPCTDIDSGLHTRSRRKISLAYYGPAGAFAQKRTVSLHKKT